MNERRLHMSCRPDRVRRERLLPTEHSQLSRVVALDPVGDAFAAPVERVLAPEWFRS